MIADVLTHVTPDGRWFHTSHDASLDRLLREMDETQMERAAVVALAGHIPSDFVLEVCARHPGRLWPVASFNCAAYADEHEARQAIRAELLGTPAVGLKLHPRLHRYDPLDVRLLAALGEIMAWSQPPIIWLDTLFYHRGTIMQKPPVDAVHTLVNLFPRLTFILLHGAGAQALALAEAIRDCPNAFMDLSFTLNRYQGTSLVTDLRALVMMFDRRLLFGSDFPEISLPVALAQWRTVLDGLPAERAERILGATLLDLVTASRPT